MDFTLTPKPVFTASEALAICSEQPVDLDFTLPDYCADVEKIFKCTVTPEVFSANLSGGQLSIEGATFLRILYCSSDKKTLRCAEQSIPFSSVYNLSTESDQYSVSVKAETNYVNCKAVSPRRLMIHGAFSLYAKVCEKKATNLYLPPVSNELQTDMKKATVSELLSLQSEVFAVSESVTPDGKSPINTVLRTDVKAVLTDATATGNRLIVKGELSFSMLYSSEQSAELPVQFTYVFPFVHNMQCSDADTSDIREIDLSLLSYDYKLKSDIASENPVVLLEAKLSVSVACRKETEVAYISDAYSTSCETQIEHTPVTLETAVLPKITNHMCKSSISLGDNQISRIIDLFCDSVAVKPMVSDRLILSGKANLCILGLNSQSELVYLERSIDIKSDEPLGMLYSACSDYSAMVKSLSYRLTDDNTMELRAEVLILTKLLKNESVMAVTSVENAGECISRENCALTLYFADSQEKVWDIAKRYKTNRDALCRENNLTTDTLDDKMLLLIPNA